MKIDNYYLDLEKINSLPDKEQKDQIHRYYMEMMHSFCDGGVRELVGKSLFNTLSEAGYLKEIRSEKIDKILS